MAKILKKCVHAFRNGNKEVAWQSLREVDQPNALVDCDSWDMGLIHHAAKHGWSDICRILVEKYHCDPLAVDREGATPLRWACDVGSVPTVEYLLSLPKVMMTVNDRDGNGDTPLHSACKFGHLPVIEVLLSHPSVSITEMDAYGLMPIECLTKFNYAILNEFSRKGIDWDTNVFVQPYFNVFMAGNTEAGKTTLTHTLEELTLDIPSQHGRVSGVKADTAGVSSTQCTE